MMDENSKLPEPQPARDVMIEAMIASALESAAAAERYGLGHDMIKLCRRRSPASAISSTSTRSSPHAAIILHLGLHQPEWAQRA